MSKWKRHIGALNSMARSSAKQNALSVVAKERAERVNRLVERMKERFNAQ
jgi:hypothetical protein